VYLGEKQHDDPEFVTESHHRMLWSLLGRYVSVVFSILYSWLMVLAFASSFMLQ